MSLKDLYEHIMNRNPYTDEESEMAFLSGGQESKRQNAYLAKVSYDEGDINAAIEHLARLERFVTMGNTIPLSLTQPEAGKLAYDEVKQKYAHLRK